MKELLQKRLEELNAARAQVANNILVQGQSLNQIDGRISECQHQLSLIPEEGE